MKLNDTWETHIKNNGADFVRFVDISSLPEEITDGCTCAVFFGKALTREYLRDIRDGRKPARQEFGNTERSMDALADKLAEKLTSEGYKSISKIKSPRLPHKTIARLAGFGFIGKNTLLVNEDYGCAVVLGKVLTDAPFEVTQPRPIEPQCGDCGVCADICPTKALRGKMWSITTRREEMLERKLCSPCLKCMVGCPYTERYIEGVIPSAIQLF